MGVRGAGGAGGGGSEGMVVTIELETVREPDYTVEQTAREVISLSMVLVFVIRAQPRLLGQSTWNCHCI